MTEIYAGATSQSVYIELVDSATGAPKIGIVYTDVTGSYVRTRDVRTAITMATLASANSAYSSGGFKEVDATNMPGIYRVDVPNAAFASAANVLETIVTIKATGCRTVSRGFRLIAWDKTYGGASGSVPSDVSYLTGASANGLIVLNSVIDGHFYGDYDANSTLTWLLDFADQWHSGNVFPPDFKTLAIQNNAVATYSMNSSGGDSSDDNGVS